MAISAPTELVHDHLASSGSSIVNTAANYTSGRLYIVACGGSGATVRTVSSVSGAGGTWTKLTSGDSSYSDGTNWSTTIFTSTDASGSSQQLTVTFSGSWSLSRYCHVFEITSGFDTSGMIVQSLNGSQAPSATSATLNLADSAASGNMRLAYFVHRVNETLTAGNGGSIVQIGNAAPAVDKGLWYYDGSTTADPNVTWTTSTRGAVFSGFELKAAASGVTGTAAWTEAADTCASSGTFTTTGSASWTEAADTVAASGWILVTGTAAWAEDADTCVASGTSANNIGTAAWTEDADTLAGTGSYGPSGTAAWTEDADTVAASGTFTTTGTAAWTEAADTCAASGTTSNGPPVAGFIATWDPSKSAFVTSAGGTVSQIDDLSGNGHDYAQATGSLQPAIGTRTINSLDALDFDGTDDILALVDTITQAQPVTIFVVAQTDTPSASNSQTIGTTGTSPTIYVGGGAWSTYAGTPVSSGVSADSNPHIFAGTFNGASSTLHLDGTQILASDVGSTGWSADAPNLGGQASATNPWNGLIGEVIVYPSALSTTDRQAVEGYLTAKWISTDLTGTAAWTEGADTLAASGTFTTTGSAAWTEAADTMAASGLAFVPITGTASWTEAADTCAASGVVTQGPVVGETTVLDERPYVVAVVEQAVYEVGTLTERPYIVQPASQQPYHVAVADERPYAVTIVDEQG